LIQVEEKETIRRLYFIEGWSTRSLQAVGAKDSRVHPLKRAEGKMWCTVTSHSSLPRRRTFHRLSWPSAFSVTAWPGQREAADAPGA
jgi:hypothetical protein